MLRSLLTCLALILLATPAIAADARAHVSIEIAPDGFVSIKQKWDGIVALDRLQYDTGTDALGVLDAVVFEGHSELDYASYELLRRDGDRLRLVIAQLDYLGNWLDFDLSVRYPANLEFINADPEPSFQSSEAHGLMWSMADRRELILIASFSGQLEAGGGKSARFGSASEADLRREAQDEALRRLEAELTGEVRGNSGNGESGNSGNTGSSSAIDRSGGQGSSAGNAGQNAGGQTEAAPASTSANDGSRMLRPGEDAEVRRESDNNEKTHESGSSTGNSPSASSSELLLDGDPLLFEFRMLINAARREGKADGDFLEALEKLLTKFYYLLEAMGASDEYDP